jgi:hypothetical protein
MMMRGSQAAELGSESRQAQTRSARDFPYHLPMPACTAVVTKLGIALGRPIRSVTSFPCDWQFAPPK